MTSTEHVRQKTRLTCTKCGSQDLCYEESETYCRRCGLVLQGVPGTEHYDYGYIIGGKRLLYINDG